MSGASINQYELYKKMRTLFAEFIVSTKEIISNEQ